MVQNTEHSPLKRVLSYQAYRSFKLCCKSLGLTELPEDFDVSTYSGIYGVERAKFVAQLGKDIEEDRDDDDIAY
jgi:hypothetical protein